MNYHCLFVIVTFMLLTLQGCKSNEELLLESLRQRDYPAALTLLVNGDLDVHARDRFGYTALHLSEDLTTSRRLLDLGADPGAAGGGVDPGVKPLKKIDLGKLGNFDLNELKRGKDYTPLHMVKNADVAELLLKHGAEVNALANYAVTPLHQAAERRDGADLVKVLLKHGADVNARTLYNSTPLHKAVDSARKDDIAAVKLLLAAGAAVNARNNHGSTPLHSIRWGNVELASLLVEHGADTTLANDSGDLPICYAIADQQVELMHFYIIRGNGILSRCSEGRNLVEYAKQKSTSHMQEAVNRAMTLILRELRKSREAEQG